MFFTKKKIPKLLNTKKIWGKAEHNGFTDLAYHKDTWYCVFREADSHQDGNNGTIRLLKSSDAKQWSSLRSFAIQGLDLRDPKLSICPDGRLLLLMTGVAFTPKGKYLSRRSYVSFSSHGNRWSPWTPILQPHDWLWRLTWHKGRGYGISYRYSNVRSRKKEWNIKLVTTSNGVDYRTLSLLSVPGYPNESTVQFSQDETLIALVRRDGEKDNHAWIGTSPPPYRKWTWDPCQQYLGGPNFVITPEGVLWCGARLLVPTPYGWMAKTALLKINDQGAIPQLILPSGGDTSYPGMVYQNGILSMSYYSTHEEKTSIYFAQISLV